MRFYQLNSAVALLLMCAGSAQAADYVKLSGTNVDFYYDADVWTLGATVTGNSISVRTDDIYERADVTEGAADPYQGQVFTAEVDFNRTFSQSVVAVAHAGYTINNNITATASASVLSNGAIGFGSYSLDNTFSRGTFSGNTFTSDGTLGGSGESYWFYYELYGNGNSGTDTVPLQISTPFSSHSAVAADGYFRGLASVTGLGTAAAGLNGVDYSFGVTAVPEPEQYAMLGAGLALIGVIAARRRKVRGNAA